MWVKLAIACALCSAIPNPTLARTEVNDETTVEFTPPGLWHHLQSAPQLLGSLEGTRTNLEDLGLTLELFYNQFFGLKAFGGVEGNTTTGNSGSYDFFALADLGELGLIPGNTVLVHVKGNYGQNINPQIGALSDPFDDADFDEPIYIAQIWTQQSLLQNRVRIRLGYLDQQTILDRNAYANSEDIQFMSAALDNNPLIPLNIGLGITLLLNPLSWLDLVFGTADADNETRSLGFDTAFDNLNSLMAYFEAAARVRLDSPQGPLPGAIRFGVFRDATNKPIFEPPGTGMGRRRRGHSGFYLNLDQQLFRERLGDFQGLGFFARYGYADQDVNRIAQFWSAGFQYQGLLPNRDKDVLAVGMYQTIPSNRYRLAIALDSNNETGVELYYNLRVLPWLAITPDLQFIVNPGGVSSVPNTLVSGLRLRIAL